MCSQADDPSQHDDTLRAALDALPVQDVTLEDGTHAGLFINKHDAMDLVDAALAASATDPQATPATGLDVERDAAIEEVIDAAIEINDVLSVRLSNALAGLDRFIATPALDALNARPAVPAQDTAQLDWRDSRGR